MNVRFSPSSPTGHPEFLVRLAWSQSGTVVTGIPSAHKMSSEYMKILTWKLESTHSTHYPEQSIFAFRAKTCLRQLGPPRRLITFHGIPSTPHYEKATDRRQELFGRSVSHTSCHTYSLKRLDEVPQAGQLQQHAPATGTFLDQEGVL